MKTNAKPGAKNSVTLTDNRTGRSWELPVIDGSIGRTDLPDSNHADLEKSIRKLMELPEDTRILPGHGDISSLAEERKANPFVREILGL